MNNILEGHSTRKVENHRSKSREGQEYRFYLISHGKKCPRETQLGLWTSTSVSKWVCVGSVAKSGEI